MNNKLIERKIEEAIVNLDKNVGSVDSHMIMAIGPGGTVLAQIARTELRNLATAIRDATVEACVGAVESALPDERQVYQYGHRYEFAFKDFRAATLKAIEALREPLN